MQGRHRNRGQKNTALRGWYSDTVGEVGWSGGSREEDEQTRTGHLANIDGAPAGH